MWPPRLTVTIITRIHLSGCKPKYKKTTDAEGNSPPCPTEKNPKLKFPKPALPQAGLLIEHWDIEGGHADLDNPDGLCQN